MDKAEEDVLAFMTFPKKHRTKLHSTNPIERLNGEIKRRTEVVGIFPDERAARRRSREASSYTTRWDTIRRLTRGKRPGNGGARIRSRGTVFVFRGKRGVSAEA